MLETVQRTNSHNKLPQIEHPIVKLQKQNTEGLLLNTNRDEDYSNGRALGFEDEARYSKARSRSHNSLRSSSQLDDLINPNNGIFLTNIPESINIKEGDPSSTRLPIFGNRSALQSRGSNSSRCSISSSIVNGASAEEIAEKFLNKLNSNYYEVRKKFIDNDPEQKGNVTREALMRLMQSITGLYVSKQSVNEILELWGVKPDKQMFSFAEINTISMNKHRSNKDPDFMDPVVRHKSKPLELAQLKSGRVWKLLKDKLSKRDIYLTDMFPDCIKFNEFSFKQKDLKMALHKMMIDLNQEEMDKLWHRIDPQKNGFVTAINFLKLLGIVKPQLFQSPKSISQPEPKNPTGNPNSFESQLKAKLREGYKQLGHEFAALDINGSGYLSPDNFLSALAHHNLTMEKELLGEFLARSNVQPTKDGIPYQQFLTKFQDRSEDGVTHRLLMSDRVDEIKNAKDPLALIQMKLVNIFQKDFLELLNLFRSYDKLQTGSITLNEFKLAIETKLDMKFTDEQFKSIIDNLPLNQDLMVPYLDFLKQFDSGQFTPAFNANSGKLRHSSLNDSSDFTLMPSEKISDKSITEIKRIIKDIFDNRFQELEQCFEQVDEANTNQLTVEMMFKLFKLMNVQPQLNRGDIRKIWRTFILSDRQTLDYKEFVRHFIYNKNTACYPNAKLFPPVKGDSDLIKRSRKLNAASDIILDGLRSKIEIFYKDIHKEFETMDTESNGCIDLNDFKEVMKEMSIYLTDTELDSICERFSRSNDKIDYNAFLRPYARTTKELQTSFTNGEKKKKSKRPSEDSNYVQNSYISKLKILHQSHIKRAIKKADYNNAGVLLLDDLRALLLLEGITLTDEESFQILNVYDSNLTGNINYMKLMNDTK